MRVLGKNMEWLLKVVEASNGTIEKPEQEKKIAMNFIL